MMMGSSLLIGLGALEQRLDLLLLRSTIQSANTFSADSIDSIAGVVIEYFKGCRRENMVDTSHMRNGKGVGIRFIQGETFDAETLPELKKCNVCFVSKSTPKSTEYNPDLGFSVEIPAAPGRFTFHDSSGGKFRSLEFNNYDSLKIALEKLFPRLMLTDFTAYRADENRKKDALEQAHRAMLEMKIKEADEMKFDMETVYSINSSFDTFFKWFHLRYYEQLEVLARLPLCTGYFIMDNRYGEKSFVLTCREIKTVKVTSIISNRSGRNKCYVEASKLGFPDQTREYEFGNAQELTDILLHRLEWIKKP